MGGGYPSGNVFQLVRVFGKSSTVCFDWIVKGEAARLRLTSGNLGLQLDHIGRRKDLLPPPVSSTLLGQSDPLTLALLEQSSLKLSKSAHHRQHQIGR